MRLRYPVTGLTMLWIILFFPIWADAQNPQQNQLTKAILLFDKGNFAEAEPVFKIYLAERPDDFMINYFYGACRTNNGHYSLQELSYLEKASQEVHPLDIDYYLGIQHQANNNFGKALEFYSKYSESASIEEQNKLELSKRILQCKNEINPFINKTDTGDTEMQNNTISETTETETDTIVEPKAKPRTAETEKANVEISEPPTSHNQNNIAVSDPVDTTQQLLTNEVLMDTVFVVSDNKPVIPTPGKKDEPIEFTVNNRITYRLLSQFKTPDGKANFEEGILKSKELEKTLLRTEFLRDQYTHSKSRTERDSVGQIILEIESITYDLKNEITDLKLRAKNIENEYWQNAGEEEITRFTKESNQISDKNSEKEAGNSEPNIDSASVIIPPLLIKENNEDVKVENQTNSDLTYKIQIGAFSRGIPNYLKPLYKKIELIRIVETYVDEKGVTVYTTGNLSRLEDALLMQKQVRQEGVEDAYIVPYLQGKRITLEQAKEIEGIK